MPIRNRPLPLALTPLCLSLFLGACDKPAEPVTAPRAVLRAEGGKYSVVPTAGQLPYCLLIEVKGETAKALPVSEDGQSAQCDMAQPAGGRSFPLPDKDDPFRVFVVFSDKQLRGDVTALQVAERLQDGARTVSPMDLRAPGQVNLEILDVKPEELRPPPAPKP